MRTTRILAVAAALPALTTALLIPLTTPAAAAPVVPATTQTITGDCEIAPDLTTVTGPSRVEVDRTVGDTAHNKGFADAAQLAAGAYAQTRTDTAHPDPERCTTQSAFTNALHVLATPGGPAIGTPVTVVATISIGGELDSLLDYTKPSDALTEIDAEVHVADPNAICNEGCPEPLTYRAEADRRVWHSQTGGLNWETSSSWSTSTSEDWSYLDDSASDFGQACATFGCPGGVPGENSGGLPAYDIGIGTRVVEFPTHVGAVLRVRGVVRSYAAATYGTTSATSDALHELKASFAPGTAGIALHVGQLAPVDTVAPQTQYAASPAPNSNGWNRTDVDVTLTATDDTAVTAFTYTLDGGPSLPVPSSGVIPVTTDGVHNVSWAAKDASGNTAQGSRTIRIDRAAPSLHLPSPIARPADASGVATVHYVAWATDDSGQTPSFGCTPATGTPFPVGNTFVQCTSTDAAGNTATGQFLVSVTEPTTVAGHLAQLRELVSTNPMDEVLRAKLLNDLTLLEKAYEKGRGPTKGCKELGDLQLRVTTATSIATGTKAVILETAGELGELLGC